VQSTGSSVSVNIISDGNYTIGTTTTTPGSGNYSNVTYYIYTNTSTLTYSRIYETLVSENKSYISINSPDPTSNADPLEVWGNNTPGNVTAWFEGYGSFAGIVLRTQGYNSNKSALKIIETNLKTIIKNTSGITPTATTNNTVTTTNINHKAYPECYKTWNTTETINAFERQIWYYQLYEVPNNDTQYVGWCTIEEKFKDTTIWKCPYYRDVPVKKKVQKVNEGIDFECRTVIAEAGLNEAYQMIKSMNQTITSLTVRIQVLENKSGITPKP
jgi:hypothetical protein